MGALAQGTNCEITDELCENHAHCSFLRIDAIISEFESESRWNFQNGLVANGFNSKNAIWVFVANVIEFK